MTPARSRWARYVLETDVASIERAMSIATFESANESFPLVRFEAGKGDPCVLISQGTAGHAFVFAELAYRIHRLGFNTFVMPKHGGHTITALAARHRDALRWIAANHGPRVGIFGEGLGGFVTFYVALGGADVRSIVCQNSPAILTEPAFRAALLGNRGAARRRRVLVPLAKVLARTLPRVRIPTSLYLDFRELVDPKEPSHRVETALIDNYLHDPEFDRSYPLEAVTSLVLTPPPAPLADLRVPTMFLVPTRGIVPEYERELFARLPPSVTKKLVEVDGSVFWMVSHPTEAARMIGDWFADTLV